MRVFTWHDLVLGAIGLALVSPGQAEFSTSPRAAVRRGVSPGYRGSDSACPARCGTSGPLYGNWSVYKNLEHTASCDNTTFHMFNIYDEVDDSARNHRIYSCSSHGSDWTNLAARNAPDAIVSNTNTTYQLGWWADGKVQPDTIKTLAQEMGDYFTNGHGPSRSSANLFVQADGGAAGIYIGKGLQKEGTADFALGYLQHNIQSLNINGGNVAMQLCGPNYDADHTFGFIASSKAAFPQIQDAIRGWAKGNCVSFHASQNISGPSYFTTPVPTPRNVTGSRHSTSNHRARHSKRGDCTTVAVVSGDSCGSLASKCGISANDFTNYNPDKDLCAKLAPGQHVCCSSGSLPDFRPSPNSDGSCHSYTVAHDDSCSTIAAANSLTNDDLEKFNGNTWGWEGCNNLMLGLNICLSSGAPPMPTADENAVCGPTKPGTKAPTDGTALADLNPCPLNACCNIWGQCGITTDFCTNTSTGAPGTAKPGTNGCISNCGTDIVKGDAPETHRNVAYYEAFSFDRPCLYQDIRQVDSSLTHLHFSFATLDAGSYAVSVGNNLSSYEFDSLKRLSGPKRILTLGGWAFSTDPSTYHIFRDGVTPANRNTMATSIANFVKDNKLDGVDIDWEYPGAPDIPGIPAGSPDDGKNYLDFLVLLKSMLGDKSVSIAAPASYWYLKAFPIKEISKVVDYIVFMAYDLHGQWDYGSSWAQEGCPTGNCLRSHVNLTETLTALSMITKAGVPSNKVVVGVSSYGRSFGMAEAGCHGPECQFTGSSSESSAKKGVCTDTAGYISNAEINEILGKGQSNGDNDKLQSRGSRVTASYVDKDSHSNILVYDDTQWVAYMDDDIKAERMILYQGLQMGGSTLWASDLSQYNKAPAPSKDWKDFKALAATGQDPYAEGDRTGNWTTLTCSDPSVANLKGLSPQQRWNMMDCPDAWRDAVNVWNQFDKGGSLSFTASISNVFHGPEQADCGQYGRTSNCEQTETCQQMAVGGSGPAGYEIWNSMVIVHEMYATYIDALHFAFSDVVSPSLQNLENTFAPVSPPKTNEWLPIVLAVVGLVGTVASSAFFNSYLSAMPYFKANKALYDNLKDTAKGLVSFGTSMASALKGGSVKDGTWTAQDQAGFSQYLGQAVYGMANVTEMSMKKLFSGDADGIKTLTDLISDGKLIAGGVNGHLAEPATTYDKATFASLEASVAKAFFALAIPALWNVSSTYAFIADSGSPCGVSDGISHYMSSDGIKHAGHCYNNNMYYLVYPHETDGQTCTTDKDGFQTCNKYIFSPAPGIGSLDGTFGGIKLEDLIVGAVRTYEQNGKQNGGGVADPTVSGTLEDMYNQDITTPGYVTMPVCSPAKAQAAIDAKQSSVANYPCNELQEISDCSDSTFVGQTSGASPKISDCQQIIKNIQHTQGEWEVENAIEQQHEVLNYGSCKFGAQGTKINGNIDFHIGAKDVIDIINTSIEKFAWNGLVGAKGEMKCKGTVKQQDVEWGLY